MKVKVIAVLFMLMYSIVFGEEPGVKAFAEKGVLTNIQTLFANAKDKNETKPGAENVSKLLTSYMVLVSAKGIYSFLEREENEKFLKDAKAGDYVEIKGKVLEAGFLVEIESLSQSKEKSEVVLKTYQDAVGQTVTLDGVNKCQCGLKVGELQHSCKLGHLHHLQTEDGKIFHYLEPDKSKDMKMHFKKVKAEFVLFPGNFIKLKEETK